VRGDCENAGEDYANWPGRDPVHASYTVKFHRNCNCLKVTCLSLSQDQR
jgi:hypothetical protein